MPNVSSPDWSRPTRSGWRILLIVAATVATLLVLACIVGAHSLAPLVQRRLIAALEDHLGAPVRVGGVSTRFHGDLTVDIGNLEAQSVLHGIPGNPTHPMLRVRHLTLHMPLLSTLLGRIVLSDATASGIMADLPAVPPVATPAATQSAASIHLSRLTLDDVHVIFATGDPTRAPLRFDLPHILLTGLDRNASATFYATVDAGSPVGLVETAGTLGPWNADDPRNTPLAGTFAFAHRDLGSVHGLRGNLSLKARYSGTLAHIDTEGKTEDTAFGFDVSAHTVALHTAYRSTIDATQGIILLRSLDAHFLHTGFHLGGTVTKSPLPQGYVLDLQLLAPAALVEDALLLGASTVPPLLRGSLQLQAHLHMPAGPASVSHKLQLTGGTFQLADASFGNPTVQHDADRLSERAKGHPKQATPALAVPTAANATGGVTLVDGILHFSDIRLTAPGAHMALAGSYTLGSTAFAMAGTLHTDATASQMNTGLKSLLTRPFNGLFAHGREGATMPLTVTGSGNTPHFRVTLPGGKSIRAID